MTFSSIDEIKEHFGLDQNDPNELRKELKKLLANSHPDKTGGTFKGKTQQRNHEELSAAIDFIDNLSTEIVLTRQELVEIKQQINNLAAIKENYENAKKEEYTKLLENHIDVSVVKFQKKHLSLKVTSIVVTSILTAIWTFPTIVEHQPLLKNLLALKSIPFTIVWIISLVAVGFIWIFTKSIEKRDRLIKKNYSIDSTQNIIFKMFCAWLQVTKYKSYEWESKTYRFSRDDLFNFILNHYNKMFDEFADYVDVSEFELYRKISDAYKDKNDLLIIRNSLKLKDKIYYFFKKPGEIDIELAHNITDTMIEKLIYRNMIKIDVTNQSLL
jgi:hypothetical protein